MSFDIANSFFMKYKKLFGFCQTPGNMERRMQYMIKAINNPIGEKTAEISTIPVYLSIFFIVYLWWFPWVFQVVSLRQNRCL
jgi:hypothetical protein